MPAVYPDWNGQMRFEFREIPWPPESARSLSVEPIPYRYARNFVTRYHYLHYAPPGAKVCLGVWYADRLVGVLLFGRPVARLEDQKYTLELTRMVLLDECPMNSESRVLALAARWVRRHLPGVRRLIAYADPARGHRGVEKDPE